MTKEKIIDFVDNVKDFLLAILWIGGTLFVAVISALITLSLVLVVPVFGDFIMLLSIAVGLVSGITYSCWFEDKYLQ